MKNATKNIKLAYDIGFCQSVHYKLVTDPVNCWEQCGEHPLWDDEHHDYRLGGRSTFDLGRAITGSKFCTRDGQDAHFLLYADQAHKEAYPVIVMIDDEVFHYTTDGRYHTDVDSDMDLFMIPTVKTFWVNLYADGVSEHYDTETAANRADSFEDKNRIGRQAWPIEITQSLGD